MDLISWDTFKKQISFKISCCYVELTQANGHYINAKICIILEEQNKILLFLDILGGEIIKFIPLTKEENDFLLKYRDSEELKNFFIEIEEELYCDYSDYEMSDSDIEPVEELNERVKRVKR